MDKNRQKGQKQTGTDINGHKRTATDKKVQKRK